MNTDEALSTLAKAYAIPEKALLAQISVIRGECGTVVSDLALSSWLKGHAQSYERGMGHYGHPVRIETLSEVALMRMAAERLEKRSHEAAVLRHIDWLARRESGSDTWTIKIPDAEPLHSLSQAAEVDADKGVAMA